MHSTYFSTPAVEEVYMLTRGSPLYDPLSSIKVAAAKAARDHGSTASDDELAAMIDRLMDGRQIQIAVLNELLDERTLRDVTRRLTELEKNVRETEQNIVNTAYGVRGQVVEARWNPVRGYWQLLSTNLQDRNRVEPPYITNDGKVIPGARHPEAKENGGWHKLAYPYAYGFNAHDPNIEVTNVFKVASYEDTWAELENDG